MTPPASPLSSAGPVGACPGLPRFEREFPASDLETRAVLQAMTTWLRDLQTDAAALDTVELILAEALNNVVEHAYADEPGSIWLCLDHRGDGLDCAIIDRGTPMPAGPPAPALPEIAPPDVLPEGGFGWFIIRSLTDDLRYRSQADCNELEFRIALGTA
jgi:serine/threonine-protein kinase RsbW